ncbi:MAG: hypothetical protein KJO98_11620 [Rhodothermia bacterium]|nr:hypothetical protein [Rhodothermia bacterium]
MKEIRFRIATILIVVALFAVGCSDNVGPDADNPTDGIGLFSGEIDPSTGSILLKTLEVEGTDAVPVRIELHGRFVRDRTPEGSIGLAVAVRNVDSKALYATAELVLTDFRPETVTPHFDFADWIICPTTTGGDTTGVGTTTGCGFGYVYSELLGDDGVLSPGETSGEKLMVFVNPNNVSFSFNVEARFGMQPNRPRIAGVFFSDHNGNGVRDPNEPPFGGGWVNVTGPGIDSVTVGVGADGTYSIGVREPGLYNLWAVPPPTFAPVEPTTSNPLEVVLLPGPNGLPQSFLHADFGWVNAPLTRPVWFISGSLDSLALDPYSLIDISLSGRVLNLHVGFSGCSPDHPLQLYMVDGFMESFPVQARLVLDHDDRGELCAAWFQQRVAFDLQPIVDEYVKSYGQLDPIILNFEASDGSVHSIEMRP